MAKYKENEQLIKEKFKLIGVGSLDSKKRITLRDKVIKEPPLRQNYDFNSCSSSLKTGSTA